MASPAAHPEVQALPGQQHGHVESSAATPFSRRLTAEWTLLAELAALNPGRLFDLATSDAAFHLTLNATPALSLTGEVLDVHRLHLVFPRYFPALPLELSLETPVFHPNIHPDTGFVCLWDRHSALNTVEHALHKTAAILGWTLSNPDPRHTMQPAAQRLTETERKMLRERLAAAPLRGVQPEAAAVREPGPSFRRRLS